MIKNRHIGKFTISRQTINDHPSEARKILNEVLVIKADIQMAADVIEYTAISAEHFNGVPISEHAPKYLVSVNGDDVIFQAL